MVLPLTCAFPVSTRVPLLSVTCTELNAGSRPCVKESVTWRGAAPTDPPTGGLALESMACACAPPPPKPSTNSDNDYSRSHGWLLLECGQSRLRASAADQRLPVGLGEDVVEIEMELPEEADARAAVAIDRDDRFEAYLEIAPNPDHTRIDRAGRDKAVAKIVRNGGCELGFDKRNQMIDEVRQP